MMTATQVFGKRAGEFAALRAKEIRLIPEQISPSEDIQRLLHKKTAFKKNGPSTQVTRKASEKFSQEVMVLRKKDGLTSCLTDIREAKGAINEEKKIDLMTYLKEISMLSVMELITTAALEREESLGSHYRNECF